MSLLSEQFPREPVVLDASVIINLLGCGEMVEVLEALGTSSIVEERTLKEINRHPIAGLDHVTILNTLRERGALLTERMTDDEYAAYLSLVQGSLTQRLGVGESAAIALAARGHLVVLDENKARGVVSRGFPGVRYTSTLRLLLTAASRASWPLARVQKLVLDARTNARMGVPRDESHLLNELMVDVGNWPPL